MHLGGVAAFEHVLEIFDVAKKKSIRGKKSL
jgi:hypothetical protein